MEDELEYQRILRLGDIARNKADLVPFLLELYRTVHPIAS